MAIVLCFKQLAVREPMVCRAVSQAEPTRRTAWIVARWPFDQYARPHTDGCCDRITTVVVIQPWLKQRDESRTRS